MWTTAHPFSWSALPSSIRNSLYAAMKKYLLIKAEAFCSNFKHQCDYGV
ncbi:hypothetical protein KR50_25150 [Jeotgalibacillus campisalis]|uniref:Uncharacterized protein n=1 Tax=Jeotgalibacillus campisalis TaxID=220754 RepID=A0A0C2VCY8_9BACL|nr:hypothetical protein KR50_25150 [Jeotgalibacillus campisalis]